ncbi:aldo/keto reductase [Pseudonocardia xinjiangensis]|uniref:aldo/keto reductase n=1 Tax=Pseudonocardia xinjiangensis TaxID=75289 RepID=UPI003D8EF5AA
MPALDSYVTLGRSGLRVSPLTLGTMTFGEDWGWGADPETSHQLLSTYLDAGGNSIDTANIYTNGHSEKIVGDFLAARPGLRDRVVLGTKFFGNLHLGDPNGGGAGRKALIEQCEQSLRRLQTDYVDLLWLHNWDRSTPIEETLRALDDLVRDGKVRYLGLSDVPAWVASEAQTIAHFRGWSPVVALQVEYSLLARTVEGAQIPMARAHGMGVMTWSPLKNGHLSGKYRRDRAVPEDARRAGMVSGTSEAEWAVVDEVDAVAAELGAAQAAVAIAWVTGRPGVASTLLGARTPQQLQANLTALDVTLDDVQRARLDAVSVPALEFPAQYLAHAPILQFAGATVDGVTHAANPPLAGSRTRY